MKRLLESILNESNNPVIIKDIITNLKSITKNFCIIGGVAVSYYTKGLRKISPDDIDIYYPIDHIEIEKLLKSIGISDIKYHTFDGTDWIISQIGSQKIDITYHSIYKEFERGLKNKVYVGYMGLKIPIIDIYSLFILKMDAGREKDILDCVFLIKKNPELKEYFDKYYKNDIQYEDVVAYLDYPIEILNKLYP